VLEKVRLYGRRPEDGMLGISNAMAGVLPAHVMCDTHDIGAVLDSGNLSTPAVFIYDRFPGGVGFAEKTYEIIEDVARSALELITECGCEEGCPSCVGSPLPTIELLGQDIDTRGKVPDKESALCILHDLLQLEPYEPKPPGEMYRRRLETAQSLAPVDPPAVPRPLEITPLPEHVESKLRRRINNGK
jgi:DEAD/DEAH box helicase domain-containing protein